MRKVRIEDSEVVEILSADPFPPFHPSLVWVQCEDEEVREGWSYTNGEFIPPPELSWYDKRSNEYPPLSELADALYWNSVGNSSHLEAYFQKCEEVKEKYPKEN